MTEQRPSPGAARPFRIRDRVSRSLDNGMRMTTVDAGSIPLAAVRLVVRTGSADVAESMTWLDRFVQEYLREGTVARDSAAFADAVAALGGRIGVESDENTTVLRTEVLSEFAPQAVELLAEMARTPRFPADEEERLRADLERDRDLAAGQPYVLALQAFRSALYDTHPYGRVLPPAETLKRFTVDAASGHWASQVGAMRSHLMVAGRFDRGSVEEAAHASFDGWIAGPAPAVQEVVPESRRVVHLVDRPGAEQSTVFVGLPVPTPAHPDYVALEVLNALLGGSFASRITMNIREDKGYTYSPHSMLSVRLGDAYWVEVADVTTDVTGASLREIFAEIERLRAEPPSEDELAGIQNYVAGAFVRRQATPGTLLDHIEFLEVHGLDEGYSAAYLDRVRAVTPAEVQRLAQAHLDPAAMTIAIAGDRAVVAPQVEVFGEVAG